MDVNYDIHGYALERSHRVAREYQDAQADQAWIAGQFGRTLSWLGRRLAAWGSQLESWQKAALFRSAVSVQEPVPVPVRATRAPRR
jgi:hypothetical protein